LPLAVGINIRKEGKEEDNSQYDQDIWQRKPEVEEIEPSAD
jgi:hypothetical protein